MDNNFPPIMGTDSGFRPPHLCGLEAMQHLPRFATAADGMLGNGVGRAVENLSRAQISQTRISSMEESSTAYDRLKK